MLLTRALGLGAAIDLRREEARAMLVVDLALSCILKW